MTTHPEVAAIEAAAYERLCELEIAAAEGVLRPRLEALVEELDTVAEAFDPEGPIYEELQMVRRSLVELYTPRRRFGRESYEFTRTDP